MQWHLNAGPTVEVTRHVPADTSGGSAVPASYKRLHKTLAITALSGEDMRVANML